VLIKWTIHYDVSTTSSFGVVSFGEGIRVVLSDFLSLYVAAFLVALYIRL